MSSPSVTPRPEPPSGAVEPLRPTPQISLGELLDRLLGSGVVLAGVDLVQVKLHAMISSVRADMADPRQAVRGGSGG